MSLQGKVLPIADEFTSVSAVKRRQDDDTDSQGSSAGAARASQQSLPANPFTLPALPATTAKPASGMAHKYRSGPSEEVDGSERDVIAPLKRESLVLPFHEGAFQPMLIQKSTQKASSTKLGQLKKSGTVQALLSPPLSKAEMKAKQNDLIQRKAQPPKYHSFQDRLAYRIDLYISTRTGQTMTLAVLGLVLIAIGACVLQAIQPTQQFHEMVWQAWTFLGDPGSHTTLIGTGLRVIGVVVTLVGILYFSVIMGFVVDGIRDKMDSLKKGKSKVAEQNHTLMLGWTDKSISLIRQICLANASEKGGTVVVLADADKEELEAELESHLRPEELRGTDVIFRTGTPLLSVDLLKVAAHQARSIIIMAQSGGDADRSDAGVLRTVLSLKTLPQLSGHIVAELRDIDNEPLVRLVGGDDVEVLVSHDVIGRLVLMSARSPGLARIFTCLLGFDGNEFYFKEWPECVGVKFSELTERFPNAIPLGIKRKSGEVLIAPDFSVVVEAGDQVMVLAEDDNTYKACPPEHIDVGDLPVPAPKPLLIERILMCGWRRDIRDMIQLLDSLVQPQTELHMLCEEPCHLRNKMLLESGLNVDALANLRIIHHYGNTAIRRHLEQLRLHQFTSLMVLSDETRESDIMQSDSHTLASLLLLRDLQNKMGKKAGRITPAEDYCKCICEVLDPRTQRTISTSETILKLSEFIQSNELVSCILAMISESRDVRVILDELLGADGASFEVEPSVRYCASTEKASYWQLAKRAMRLGEILCGYQMRGAVDETVLNPPNKAERKSWLGIDFVVLRRKNESSIVHQASPQPIQVDDFERTTLNRAGKASFVRHQILEALVQEQEIANLEQLDGQQRDLLTRAVRSYVDLTHGERSDDGGDAAAAAAVPVPDGRQIRQLISVARMLADSLEQIDGMQDSVANRHGSIDASDEKVSEFDMSSI